MEDRVATRAHLWYGFPLCLILGGCVTPATELQALLDEGKVTEAVGHVADNDEWFATKAARNPALLDPLRAELDRFESDRVNSELNKLGNIAEIAGQPERWSSTKKGLAKTRTWLSRLEKRPLYQDNPNAFPASAASRERHQQISDELVTNLDATYAAHLQRDDTSFFTAYPIKIADSARTALVSRQLKALDAGGSTLPPEVLKRLMRDANRYAGGEALDLVMTKAYRTELDRLVRAHRRLTLHELAKAAERARPFGFDRLPPEQYRIQVASNPYLAKVSIPPADEALWAAASGSASPARLKATLASALPAAFVIPLESDVVETLQSRETVSSNHPGANRVSANPEVARLRQRASELRREVGKKRAASAGAMARFQTGLAALANPSSLVDELTSQLQGAEAIADSVSRWAEGKSADQLQVELDRVENQIATTPATLSETDSVSYQYERSVAALSRDTTLLVVMRNLFSGTYELHELRMNESQEYAIGDGVHPNDPSAPGDLLTKNDYINLLSAGIELDLDSVFRKLAPDAPSMLLSGLSEQQLLAMLGGRVR